MAANKVLHTTANAHLTTIDADTNDGSAGPIRHDTLPLKAVQPRAVAPKAEVLKIKKYIRECFNVVVVQLKKVHQPKGTWFH